jgi:hypothetical protein
MQGTHTPGSSRSDTFLLVYNVNVYGGFDGAETALDQRDAGAHITILSGDINGDDTGLVVDGSIQNNGENNYHVVTVSSPSYFYAVLDGFTITAGNANGSANDQKGGGMFIEGLVGAAPVLKNLTFYNNTATHGGGIFSGPKDYPTITDTTFSQNASSSAGGGLYYQGEPSSSATAFQNLTFSKNTADFGGSIGEGGGIYFQGKFAETYFFTNITFYENRARGAGGAISRNNGNLIFQNSIFWDNDDETNGNISINDSIVQSGCPTGATCSNIITADPVLGTLTDNGGPTNTIAIGAGSSAIDAGNDASCTTTDQRGFSRSQGASCDIGAYEFDSAPVLTSFTRQTPATPSTNADSLVFRATFDEDVQNVSTADFTVSGSTASVTNVNAVDAATYDISVSGGDLAGLNGVVGINLSGSQDIQDLTGNNNLPAGEPVTDETYTVDNIGPSTAPGTPDLASASDTGDLSTDNITSDNTPQFTGTCTTGNIVTINSSADGALSPTGTCSGGSYDITITSSMSDDSHTMSATQADDAGNNSPSSGTIGVTVDTVNPTVTVEQASGQADPTNTTPINFTIIFSKAVNGFTSGDLTITGTAGATIGTVTETAPNDGTTYNVAVSNVPNDGTVITSVGASKATDVAGNGNDASTSTDNIVTRSTTPEIDISGSGNSISDGDITPSSSDDTNFGNVLAESGTKTNTYTITNTGLEDLSLTGTPKVSISGANATEFAILAQPASPVNSNGGTTTFSIMFDPNALGVRSATVNVTSDDSDEGTYTFDIQGTGTIPFENRTTSDGLGSNWVESVYYDTNTIYAGTTQGLSTSSNGGTTFINKKIGSGSIHQIRAVYADGNNIYAGNWDGLLISTDGGTTYANKTTADGLAHNIINSIYVSNGTIYAGTHGGLSVSTDGGTSFSTIIGSSTIVNPIVKTTN